MEHPSRTMLYLSKRDILNLKGDTSTLYIRALREAFVLHANGQTVQPLKPYLRWRGDAGHIADRIIAMPAYVGGDNAVAGLKWIGSKHDNPARHGIERASALIVLNDADTHYPIAVMEGSLISGMRTAAVTAIATHYLAREGFERVTCLGCGPIGRMQMTTLLEQFPSIRDVHLFDLSVEAAQRIREYLQERFPSVRYHLAPSAEAAVKSGEVVVTCTVTDTPYLPYEWLQPGTFLSNVSIMDVEKEAFLKVDKVVVDDWDQCNREKKVINQLVLEGRFSREQLHAELGEIVSGRRPGRENPDEIILLNPMGLAIEDVACAYALYRAAVAANIGVWLPLDE